MSTLVELKKVVFDYTRLRLGDQIVDIELDPAHYEVAYSRAIGVYRQRAQNAYEESYNFLELQEDVNVYTMPAEVMSVRQVIRRQFGNTQGPSASNFDSFASASLNSYLLNAGSPMGGLATYEFYAQYVDLSAKMLGGFMNYTYNQATKKLQLIRDPKGTGEVVMIWAYNLKPEITLLTDLQISQWIKDFTTASAKQIMGEAREKFASIAGPQGGSQLNGAALKTEAQAEIDKLIEELKLYVDGSSPYSFIIG
jgi:hypothetical protein